MIRLGQKARDKVTGVEGIITGRIQYLYGCDQYCIVPPAKDGKVISGEWFDEGRVQVIGDGIAPAEVQVEKPGGVNRDAPKGKY